MLFDHFRISLLGETLECGLALNLSLSLSLDLTRVLIINQISGGEFRDKKQNDLSNSSQGTYRPAHNFILHKQTR